MERTEEEKLVQAPILVILGGKEYPIRPLVIKDSRVWRQKVCEMLSSLPQYTQATTDTPDKFQTALSSLIVAMPDAVVDRFFEYAKNINREEIEQVATDVEIATAFEQVVEVAFPLFRSLVKTMQQLAR